MPNEDYEIIWEPLHGSQELAIDTRCEETLFCGSRGPGKTDTQLMLFRKSVGIGYGPFWRGIIFDREYKSLDDLISKSKRWFSAFDDGARFISSKDNYRWVWPTGEELLFRAIKKKEEYNKIHGQEFPFIGWNEITKWPTSEIYDMVQSCNRSSFTPEKDNPELPNIPLITFSTCNPWGAGRIWVKRKWIDNAEYGQITVKETEIFNPKTQKREIIKRRQVAIFGSYKENIYLDPIYIASLENITDENLKAAWLKGDWNAVCGSALSDVWNKQIHVKRRFVVPKNWRIDRSFDWGSTHPFSVGWWAEANGEEALLLDGTKFCPQVGSLIQIAQWYGTKEIGTNKGLQMSATDIAKGIVEREIEMMQNGWIKSQPYPGPADNQIGNTTEIDVETIATKMAKHGVRWLESDKSQGSRIRGLQVMRDRLQASMDNEGPGLYFMDNCIASISTIPELPRDLDKPDDIDCFIAGTMVETINGSMAIESIPVGTLVKTPIGYRPIIASYFSGLSKTIKIKLKNGTELEGTPRHKVFVEGLGMVRLDNLEQGLTLSAKTCNLSSCENKLYIVTLHTQDPKEDFIISRAKEDSQIISKVCIDKFGLIILDLFLKTMIFIILMKIQIITILQTLNVLRTRFITNYILHLEQKKELYLNKLKHGEIVKKEKKHLEKMLEKCLKELPFGNLRALIVEYLLKHNIQHKNVVALNVQQNILTELILGFAKFAANLFRGRKQNIVLPELAVISVDGCLEKKKVYNITVEQAHLFYANGVLVTNTDSEDHPYDMVRYRCTKGNNREAKVIQIKQVI